VVHSAYHGAMTRSESARNASSFESLTVCAQVADWFYQAPSPAGMPREKGKTDAMG
jgi:hypothetical protein